MARINKIETHKLGPRILELHLHEGRTSEQIAEILTKDGFPISQPTVSRWISKQREDHKGEVSQAVSDHVKKVIPDDLNALEDMEKLCLDWAGEEPDTKVERILTWQKVQDSFKKWQEQILSADNDTRKDIIKAVIRQCLDWILEDVDSQKQRIFAMRMAATIIDTKLRYSGILEGAGQGNIYIQPAPQEPEENPEDQDQLSKKRQLHIVGEGEDYEG